MVGAECHKEAGGRRDNSLIIIGIRWDRGNLGCLIVVIQMQAGGEAATLCRVDLLGEEAAPVEKVPIRSRPNEDLNIKNKQIREGHGAQMLMGGCRRSSGLQPLYLSCL